MLWQERIRLREQKVGEADSSCILLYKATVESGYAHITLGGKAMCLLVDLRLKEDENLAPPTFGTSAHSS